MIEAFARLIVLLGVAVFTGAAFLVFAWAAFFAMKIARKIFSEENND